MAGEETHDEPCRGSAIAHIDRAFRFQKRADADADDGPAAVAPLGDTDTHPAERRGRGAYVLSGQQTVDMGPPAGERAQHERPVRDGLVARHPNRARQRSVRV